MCCKLQKDLLILLKERLNRLQWIKHVYVQSLLSTWLFHPELAESVMVRAGGPE